MFDRHAYYLAHRSEILERQRFYRESHREALRESGRVASKRWRASHSELYRERQRKASKRYRESHLELERKRKRESSKLFSKSEVGRKYKNEYYLAHRSETLERQRVRDAHLSEENVSVSGFSSVSGIGV